jgi:fluoride ion exporter CrcB/FEX
MPKRSSLVSNVMHSFRHALHINLHMFVCLQAVFVIGTWAIYGFAALLGDRCSVSLLRAILSHLCRPHPSSLAQPWTQACMNVSTVFVCICLYIFNWWSAIDVQMFEESSVGVLAFMSTRSSLVSNVMHSFRHALHINLHMFVCLQAVFVIGTW